ncbi:MAG: DUF2079 domain-containing protein [Ruminiclostridium sp.]|nr:DUF2079 domain-containing protein [Ruminiclostridium sp.]
MQYIKDNEYPEKETSEDTSRFPNSEPFPEPSCEKIIIEDSNEEGNKEGNNNEEVNEKIINDNDDKDKRISYSVTTKIFIKTKEVLMDVYSIRSELLVILLSSFLMISLFNMLRIKTPASGLDFLKSINILASIRSFIILSVLAGVLRLYFYDRRFTLLYLFLSTYGFTFWLIYEFPKDLYLTLGCIAIVGVITYNLIREEKDSFTITPIKKNVDFLILFTLFAGAATILSFATIYRYRSFGSSNFDFGIFAQVFEYLKTTGLPLSTTERDKLLSHFAVHFSPIYYTILPGYLLFDTPEYLLVMQAILICSAVFPIFFICRHYRLNNMISLLISVTYLVYPGTISPAMFDFHENKFLTVLILWMIYFFEKKKPAPMYIFMILTLMVKEDAAIYILFLGLFFMLVRKDFYHGSIISISAIVYFIIVVTLMTKYGEGVMDNRFVAYLQEGERGLSNIVKNVVLNPAYFIKNIFTSEKLEFVLYMMMPLLFVPLVSKELKRLILLIPMILINLMALYPYQANIGYQYTYGVAAILFFMFIINLKDFKNKYIIMICTISVFASFTLTITSVGNKVSYYRKAYMTDKEKYAETERILEKIPSYASVTATTYMIPHLSKVKILYMYPSLNQTEYFVLDARERDTKAEIEKMLEENGYKMIGSGGIAYVYKKQ